MAPPETLMLFWRFVAPTNTFVPDTLSPPDTVRDPYNAVRPDIVAPPDTPNPVEIFAEVAVIVDKLIVATVKF